MKSSRASRGLALALAAGLPLLLTAPPVAAQSSGEPAAMGQPMPLGPPPAATARCTATVRSTFS